MKKLKRFLLVDDSKATNFFNKTVILKTDLVEEVIAVTNGKEALETIHSGVIPEVIFLDLNMPVMNGWEFLETYHQASNQFQDSKIMVMLGAKLNKEDEQKLASFSQVIGFREKMLTKPILLEIISTYFKEYLPA
ncbi:response regulator [Aquimarina litoralis]|uniref:response regulator n=1 Tax=Aquimarina litoralis TaxID=584605 RepID=UPI001C58F1A2|nr:response regulator [Aquimarina litoralis]MBW1297295.1 response regulator [Aquimarina litoralis]